MQNLIEKQKDKLYLIKKENVKKFLIKGLSDFIANTNLDNEELVYYLEENYNLIKVIKSLKNDLIVLYENPISGWFTIAQNRIDELMEC